LRTLRCYRCEESIPISNDTVVIEEGHGRFSVTIDGRYHSFSNKKISLGEDTDTDIWTTPAEPVEEEIITALEDVAGIENIAGEDHGY